MLGKLFKYEMKATARWFLPMYAGVIFFSIINKIFMSLSFSSSESSMELLPSVVQLVLSMASSLSLVLYVLIIIATFALTFFIMLQRFYKNLLGDEGYLMFTLPVKPSAHIWSKLFVSSLWYLCSFAVTMLSVFILLINKVDWDSVIITIRQVFHVLSTYQGINVLLLIVETIVLTLVSLVGGTLMFYAAIAMGHTRNNHKVLYSFGAYLILNFITQILSTVLMLVCTLPFQQDIVTFFNQEVPPEMYLHMLMIGSLVLTLILSVGYFIITNYILKNKLNLE